MSYSATMPVRTKMLLLVTAFFAPLATACSETPSSTSPTNQDTDRVETSDGSFADLQGSEADSVDTDSSEKQDTALEGDAKDLPTDTQVDVQTEPSDVSLSADVGDGTAVKDTWGTTDVNLDADTATGEPDTETVDPSPDVQSPKKLWLLSVDNGKKTLQVVDVETGQATDLCNLAALDSYPSLTFSRLNGLYGSRGGYTLDRINPCTCEIMPIGGYGGPTGVFGITADPGDALFGVATTQDVAISIEVVMGAATQLGELGVNFTTSGATYSQDDTKIYAINGGDDKLYSIDMKTGAASEIASLNYDFGSVGIEVHPANNKLYACSSKAELLEVDPTTGMVTVIGPMNQSGSCTNLAAPWFDVPCINLP